MTPEQIEEQLVEIKAHLAAIEEQFVERAAHWQALVDEFLQREREKLDGTN